MRPIVAIILSTFVVYQVSGQPVANSGGPTNSPNGSTNSTEPPWDLVIYPIGWAPVFGANVSLPSIPSGGLPGVSISGILPVNGTMPVSRSTSFSINGAAMGSVYFRYGHWITEFNVLWADVSASRDGASISTQASLGDLFGGYRIVDSLAVTAGARRLGLKIGAQAGDLPKIEWKPSVWDPIVGIDWRPKLGRKWTAELRVDGGGFGVGSDVDVSAFLRADWRLAQHFGLAFGYGALYYQNTRTILTRSFKTSQTLNGPIFGFAIYI